MLRSVLVALDGSPFSESASTLACEWARRFDARLVGVGIVDEPSIERPEPVPMGAYGFKKLRDKARITDAHRRVLKFLARFEEQCTGAGVTATFLEDIGNPTERILHEAHRCDVVILGRETHFHFETQTRSDRTLADVLRNSSRPIVVVPRELRPGRGVVVAYGGGREASRTLQTFQLLGLADGENIDVVTVHHDHAEAAALASSASEFLTAHGAPHQVHAIATDSAVADVLLEEVQRRAPRLLVMGAHGHHPWRDIFVTSVARAVLRASPVPVFAGA